MLPPPTPTDRQIARDVNAEEPIGPYQQYQLSLSYRKRPRPAGGFSSSSEDDETENRPQQGHENHQHEMNEERLHFLQRRQYHLQHQQQQPNQSPQLNDNTFTNHSISDTNHLPEISQHRESRKRPRELSSSIPTQIEFVQQHNAASVPQSHSHQEQPAADTHHQGHKRVKLLSSLSALTIQPPTAQCHASLSQHHQHFQDMGQQPPSLWQMNQLLHQLHQERCSRRQEQNSLSNSQHHHMNQSTINKLFPSPQLSLQAPSTSSSSQYSNDTPTNDAMDDD